MNRGVEYEKRSLVNFNGPGGTRAVALLLLLPMAALAGGVVTNCTEAGLRTAMAGGGVVTFACDGTITLASTITNVADTTLDGTGHQVTINGGGAVRVFHVNTNGSFSMINLKVANGASLSGSAILNVGGIVNLAGVAFQSNRAVGVGGALTTEAYGGAVFNSGGTIYATQCSFEGNSAFQWEQMDPVVVGRPARGGAVYNRGTATLDLCTFTGNSATGGDGTSAISPSMEGLPGGAGAGGAIYNEGTLTIDRTTLSSNTATGGHGGRGGDGELPSSVWGGPGGFGAQGAGGAIYNAGSLWAARSTFASNVVVGGSGGAGGNSVDFPSEHCAGGVGGGGGAGAGGALCGSEGAQTTLINCTMAFSAGSGADGGRGGNGSGARGGNGGNGGAGCGGVSGPCNLTNCTIAWNAGRGGAGGAAGVGSPNGTPGADGIANGGTASSTLVNTLIASNTPAGNESFPDPKLGPLEDNGGPTLTMALLPDSPAIDAGDTALAPTTDQRGFPRPAGLAADIGAFEYGSVMPNLAISPSGTNSQSLLGSGNVGQSCRLLSSPDLSSWMPVATNQIGGDGTVLFYDTCGPGSTSRFYRLVMP